MQTAAYLRSTPSNRNKLALFLSRLSKDTTLPVSNWIQVQSDTGAQHNQNQRVLQAKKINIYSSLCFFTVFYNNILQSVPNLKNIVFVMRPDRRSGE